MKHKQAINVFHQGAKLGGKEAFIEAKNKFY